MPPRRKVKTTLFFRISIRLIFPLALLITAFAAIQLTNQLTFLNKVYEIQSRISIQALTELFTRILEEPRHFENPYLLRARVEKGKEAHGASEILLIDPLTREVLFSEKDAGASLEDLAAAERSILDKKAEKPPLILIDKEVQKLNAFIPIVSSLRERTYVAKITFPLGNLKLAFQKSMGALIAMFLLTLLSGFLIAGALSRSIVKPIQTLNRATREILKGELGQKVAIYTGDEIQELAETFNRMSIALKSMKERAEDANPLTQLPGNHGIYYEVQRRIHEKQKFVFFHTDIDRFKVFNDHYGLARGDDVIRKTAKTLRESLAEKGVPDDFLGHQGGDDFVIICQPQRAVAIAETVIGKFQQIVRTLYRKEDYERGYVLEQDRRSADGQPGQLVKFPLIALSLAGVANTKRDFTDYYDLLTRTVDVKKQVKKVTESCYVIQE